MSFLSRTATDYEIEYMEKIGSGTPVSTASVYPLSTGIINTQKSTLIKLVKLLYVVLFFCRLCLHVSEPDLCGLSFVSIMC